MVDCGLLGWHTVAFPLDICWLAMGKIQVLGFWVALAMVVLDSPDLVYSVADHRLGVVAGMVGLVDLDMVAFSLDLLVVLVVGYIQRSHHLAMAPG